MFGAARRAHHRAQERMRAETALRNQMEAAQRARQAQEDAMRRMQEQAARAQQLMITQQAEAYRKQAEATIQAAQLQIKGFEEREERQRQATELQKRLATQAQVSSARGGAAASLTIAQSAPTESTAGTQAFKRRGRRQQLAPIQSTAGINVPSGSVLNV
jgi:hypothetical protein